MSNLQQYRNKLERQKGKKIQIESNITNLTKELRLLKRSQRRHEKALEIVKEVGLKTQQQLQYNISNITSLALETVFEDPYELKVEFVERRNKTECDLYFERDKNKIDPMTASGVGAIDVAAFALRIAAWSMKKPRSSNVIILDEPFKHLRGEEENEKALQMIQEISKKLNIQIIMVGDVKVSKEILLEYADKLFETKIINKKTKIYVSN